MTNEEAIKAIKEHCLFNRLLPVAKKALNYAIQVLRQTRWIPVSEKLPEPYKLESSIEKRKEWPHKPCINYEEDCEAWAGCPCVYYKAEMESD